MPLISHFYGILIYIFSEKNQRHHKPHFHARYAGAEASFAFDGKVLEGDFPRKLCCTKKSSTRHGKPGTKAAKPSRLKG